MAEANRLTRPPDITPRLNWGTAAVGPTRSPLDVLVAGDAAVRLGYQMSADYRSLACAALAKLYEQQTELARQRETIIRLRAEFAEFRERHRVRTTEAA